MAATLKDVAELAGVSIATVSRVLNDPEKVAEGSRLKVMAAVEKLGYSSNLLAKSLRQDGLNAVYVLLPSLSDPYFAQMHQAISDVLFSYGYLMLSAATEGSLELEQECLAKVRSLNPSGVLMYTAHPTVPEGWSSYLTEAPMLFLSGNRLVGEKKNMTALSIDRRTIGAQAAAYLWETGCRNFIYLCDGPKHLDGEYWAGIQSVAETNGGSCRLCFSSRSIEDATRELDKVLDPSAPAADCVLTQSNLQAAGVLSALRARGLAVPEQVSVMSFENTELACLTTPQLSVIGPSSYQIGMIGTMELLNQISAQKGGQLHPNGTLDLKLIPRGSTHARV